MRPIARPSFWLYPADSGLGAAPYSPIWKLWLVEICQYDCGLGADEISHSFVAIPVLQVGVRDFKTPLCRNHTHAKSVLVADSTFRHSNNISVGDSRDPRSRKAVRKENGLISQFKHAGKHNAPDDHKNSESGENYSQGDEARKDYPDIIPSKANHAKG